MSRRMALSLREATMGSSSVAVKTSVRRPGPRSSPSIGRNPTMASDRQYFPYPR
jgi:hypothetical protein